MGSTPKPAVLTAVSLSEEIREVPQPTGDMQSHGPGGGQFKIAFAVPSGGTPARGGGRKPALLVAGENSPAPHCSIQSAHPTGRPADVAEDCHKCHVDSLLVTGAEVEHENFHGCAIQARNLLHWMGFVRADLVGGGSAIGAARPLPFIT